MTNAEPQRATSIKASGYILRRTKTDPILCLYGTDKAFQEAIMELKFGGDWRELSWISGVEYHPGMNDQEEEGQRQ